MLIYALAFFTLCIAYDKVYSNDTYPQGKIQWYQNFFFILDGSYMDCL